MDLERPASPLRFLPPAKLETGDVYEWWDEAQQKHYGVRYEWLE